MGLHACVPRRGVGARGRPLEGEVRFYAIPPLGTISPWASVN